jgi:hypothetical protein
MAISSNHMMLFSQSASQDSILPFPSLVPHPPTEKKRQIMNNLFLAHELLNGDDPNVKLLRFQMEKSLVIDAFFRGFSPSEEPLDEDENISENMERFADILEVLPRVIALFEGMKEGSFLPLISLSLFAESFGVPGACIFPLVNVALGAYEQLYPGG